LQKETCADCHSSSGAGDDCTLCHNYHVGDFKATLPISELAAQRKSK
jgi:nitrate/TMAO reductase-like tetraheme cytochrome c subunit